MSKQSITNVDGDKHDLVAVAHNWLSSAFGVAIGEHTSEVCRRFSDDLDTLLTLREKSSASEMGDQEFLDRLRTIQLRLSMAAEWSERLERAEVRQ